MGVLGDHKMQKSGKSTKRLDRLAPNVVTICRFIWEWTYAKTISPSIPQGEFCGFRGSKCKSLENLPNGWTDWHQIWYMSADSSGNGHRLKQLAPRYTRGHWGGVRGQKKKSLENLPNGWTDWHQIWYTSADSHGNGHRLKTNSSSRPGGGGHFGV